MSARQRVAILARYLVGERRRRQPDGARRSHPDALGAAAIHGRLVRMDPLPPLTSASGLPPVQWAESRPVARRDGARGAAARRSDEGLRRPADAQGAGQMPGASRQSSVDPARNEVILTDENLFQVLAYNRLDNTAPRTRSRRPSACCRATAR